MSGAARIARECGIVGAGGAGFPTHVKLQARADTFAVNAAECEPLLYKDQEILENFLEPFAEGLVRCGEAVGARRLLVGIKDKHPRLIERLRDELPRSVEVLTLRDTYPSGDEHILVWETTRRAIPKGGLPLDVGVVVQNVETVLNVGLAKPVTEKFVTISGAVPEVLTLRVPLGTSLRDVLSAAGAPVSGMGYVVNGAMMGTVAEDLDEPVTKTTSGILVLPLDHSVLARKKRTPLQVHKIAATCDQCMRCSDLCPRDLLGHFVKPHKAMISIGFAPDQAVAWQETALYCCECALCSLYACPEDLDPFRVMVESKRALLARGVRPSKEEVAPSPLFEYRRTPTRLLMRRLDLLRFEAPHRFDARPIPARILRLPLKQHAGAPSAPTVQSGDRVQAGQVVAEIPDRALGARIFAPKSGRVLVDESAVTVEVS
ncbi:MAG: 4Fe-4S dicluster domain-containing protein [Acidobacteriota bacterium]